MLVFMETPYLGLLVLAAWGCNPLDYAGVYGYINHKYYVFIHPVEHTMTHSELVSKMEHMFKEGKYSSLHAMQQFTFRVV